MSLASAYSDALRGEAAGTVFAVRDGMSWFRVSAGRLEYRGRLTREPFTRWAATRDGALVIGRVAAGIRFSLFGRSAAARRQVWRELEEAARDESLAAGVADEAARYMDVLAALSYSDGLPRVNLALHRLVLLPRAMIAGHVRAALFKRLADAPALGGLDPATRTFFLDRLVFEMDAALQKAAPGPRQPVQARDEWACVGVSKGVVWVDPLWAGDDATGHVFMYEFPRPGMPRPTPRELNAAIADMTAGVGTLSRLQRFAMVRAATTR